MTDHGQEYLKKHQFNLSKNNSQKEKESWEQEFEAKQATLGNSPQTLSSQDLPKEPNSKMLMEFVNSLSEKQQEEFSKISGYMQSVKERLDSDNADLAKAYSIMEQENASIKKESETYMRQIEDLQLENNSLQSDKIELQNEKVELEELLIKLLNPKSWNDTTLTSIKQKLNHFIQEK